jgi:hypothetical protein
MNELHGHGLMHNLNRLAQPGFESSSPNLMTLNDLVEGPFQACAVKHVLHADRDALVVKRGSTSDA